MTGGLAAHESYRSARTPFRDVGRAPRFEELLEPLSKLSFYEEHWRCNEPYLSPPNEEVAARLETCPGLASVETLLERYRQKVFLLGPGPTRRSVEPGEARRQLEGGSNLYFTRVEEALPELKVFTKAVAFDLCVAPWQVGIEAFAGRCGGTSSRHYDHDANFQILLAGEKEWMLEPNIALANPLEPFHPARDAAGAWSRCSEEGYASHRPLPMAFDHEQARSLRSTRGTTLFIPRGYWHEASSVTDTWGINLVVKGVSWATALAMDLVASLHRDPEFRAYGEGYRGRGLSEAQLVERNALFVRLKREAIQNLERLSLSDVELAPMGEHEYAWSDRAIARRFVESAEGCFLVAPGIEPERLRIPTSFARTVARLCEFQGIFKLKHVRVASPELPADAVYGVIALLVTNGLLERRGRSVRE